MATRARPIIVLFLSALSYAEPPPIHRHVLKDGLEVLVAENHSLPLVTVEIAVRNGSMTESPEYNGLSHLYEHMFFKANAVIPNQEAYMQRVRELGMVFNGSTGTERVNYFFTTTKDHLPEAMAFMRDAIASPLFESKELDRERVVVTGEIDRDEANPYYHFWHTLEQHVWWKYPSRKDPLGNRKTVLTATPQMMRTIQKRYYVPNNSVLIVTGDVVAADIDSMAEQLYAKWPPGEDPFKKFPLVKHPALPKTEVVVVEQPVQTLTGELIWHGPSSAGSTVPMTYPADVLSFAVREPSSKFQKDTVDSGACVSASMGWQTQRNVGPVSASFEALPSKADECVRAILAELPKMKLPDYLSDDEMRDAVHAAEVEQALGREKASGFAHEISSWWASAGLDYYLTYVENLRKVTREQIAAYLNEYVLGKPYVFGVLVSPAMVKEQHLDQAHFERLLGLGAAAQGADR